MNSASRGQRADNTVLGPFSQGLLAAVALGALTSGSGASADAVVPAAAGMGVAAAVFTIAPFLRGIADWFYFLICLAAFFPAVSEFLISNGCLAGPPPTLRYIGLILLLAITVLSFALSWWHARPRLWHFSPFPFLTRRSPLSAIGLALYGALEIFVSAMTFLAGNDSSQSGLVLAVLIPGAAVLGWFVVAYAEIVVAVAGVAFGMQAIYSAATPGCGQANFSGVVLIAVFCAAYFATRALCAPFATNR